MSNTPSVFCGGFSESACLCGTEEEPETEETFTVSSHEAGAGS